MFGENIDYLILRRLAHKRNLATEDDLNRNIMGSLQPVEEKNIILKKHIVHFEGKFPISSNLRYLDIGCGKGELTILLAKLGCGHIMGIDIVPRNIATCEFYANQFDLGHAVQFKCMDIYNWVPPQKYNVLLSLDVFEHIHDPKRLLQRMTELVTTNGVVVLTFGPLFHSPFGDHMRGFFRIQIPWRGVLFSEKAILRIRRECYRPTDFADHYQDIVGGLNLMRYSEFQRYVHETGWNFSFLALNPSLKNLRPLNFVSNILTRIPFIKDYFVYSVYAILHRST